jgi:hypothetical protein
MKATATFSTKDFTPTTVNANPAITTALPVSVSTMEKRFTGEIEGRSATLFTAAFDHARRMGTYIAMESFEGSMHGLRAHSTSCTRHPQQALSVPMNFLVL